MSGRLFYSIIIGFGSGIFLSSFVPMGFSIFLLTTTLSVVVLFLSWRGVFKDHRVVFMLVIFVLCFGLGSLRFTIENIKHEKLSQLLWKEENTKINIVGRVVDEPVLGNTNQKAIVLIKTNKESANSPEARILVQSDINPKLNYGDIIEVAGKLEKPTSEIVDETGRIFDYREYLANQDVFYQIAFAQVKILDRKQGSVWLASLYDLKSGFMDNIKSVISEPKSSYLGALLFGDKTTLPKEWKDIFVKAGITHIVALSGYNITIIAEWLGKVLSLFLGLGWSLGLGALGIIGFVIMTGASATAVRSGIMALIVIFGRTIGRQYDIKRALFFAGFVMLLFEPRLLVFDISFQLSFLATLSLIYVSPIIDKKIPWLTPKWHIKELVVATISAQVLVLPLILYKLGWLSFISVFANLVILPLIPVTMFFGFFTGSLGYVSHVLSLLPGLITDTLLVSELFLAKVFADLPFSAIRLRSFSVWWSVLAYALIWTWLYQQNKKALK